jgi:hypothetical protein
MHLLVCHSPLEITVFSVPAAGKDSFHIGEGVRDVRAVAETIVERWLHSKG